MAGVYIHIPFCKKACYYCDFHFTVSLKNKKELLEALCKEIYIQRDYLKKETIETIYFGGGTPSILSSVEIKRILDTVYSNFNISEHPEITFEANPENLSVEYLKKLKATSINRLSIGAQSFFNDDLKLLNRIHTAEESKNSILRAKKLGYRNINIDLMYGLPGLSLQKWEKNLDILFNLDVQHISAYHLTFEPKTVFASFLRKGKIRAQEENISVEQFNTLIYRMEQEGFIHYEISNFALKGFFSKHNLGYWQNRKYLGLGPSANSYDGLSRQWNISLNNKYIELINQSRKFYDNEILDNITKYNDYILTSLRTMWGIDLKFINKEFGKEIYNNCVNIAEKYIKYSKAIKKDDKIILTDEGKFISDQIITDFMGVE